jgi:hypothetical protein
MHRAIVQAALVLSTQQNRCIFRKVKERGPSNESLLCPGDHRTALAFSYARCCRHYLSDTAVPRVRRHRLHPNCGAVRDSGAIISPQVIPAGCKAAVILLLSVVRATNDRRPIRKTRRKESRQASGSTRQETGMNCRVSIWCFGLPRENDPARVEIKRGRSPAPFCRETERRSVLTVAGAIAGIVR